MTTDRREYQAPREVTYTQLKKGQQQSLEIHSLQTISPSLPSSAQDDRSILESNFSTYSTPQISFIGSPKVPLNNIILGMAKDIDPKNFVVFCASLRETAKSGADVMIWVNFPVDRRIQEIATRFYVNLSVYTERDLKPHLRKYHPSTLRWILFHSYLSNLERIGKYDQIWMVDVRDTMFQLDPFGEETHLYVNMKGSSSKEVFNVFTGVEHIPIGQCGWNSGWIRDCFGEKILKQIENKMIICSGVSMGTTKMVMEYLQYMTQIFDNDFDKASDGLSAVMGTSKFPACERNGVDQGVHNVLIHMKLLNFGETKIWKQQHSSVLNLQAKALSTIIRQSPVGDSVRNLDGKVAAVVHQYDRNEILQKRLFEKYVYWINTSDPLNEWRLTKECESFNIVAKKELFKGICDIKHIGGATAPSTCCSLCLNSNGCKGFSFAMGSCFLKNCLPSSNGKQIIMEGVYSAYIRH